MSGTESALIDCFRRLSQTDAERPTQEILREVAAFFSATHVGLGPWNGDGDELVFSDKPVNGFSWRTDSQLMQRLRGSWTACTHLDGDGEWLISLVAEPGGEGRLAWAFRNGRRGWSEADKVLWMSAAQALVRWLYQPGAETAAARRRIEQAAVIASRLCHDFGNYLTGIMGFTELSLSQAPLDSPLHRYLNEVLESAKQGADWIRRLHIFSRRGTSPVWPTQLASVLAQEDANLRGTGVFGMQLRTQTAADLPLLAIDAEALEMALAEIIANARDAGRNQGTVSVSSRAVELSAVDCKVLLGAAVPGPYVEVSISDDGPGIAPEDRAKLFRDIFFSTKPRHRGLGLLLVYGIMQRCRGAMRIDAGPDGKGTCVKLYVPKAVIDGPAIEAGRGTPHVLLVHADPLLTSSMKEVLEARACKVSVASNPHAALTICRTKGANVGVVVTDLMLPHLGGLELARRVLDFDPDISFIFLLAQASFHGLRDEELLKRFDLVRWPSEPASFAAVIQNALAKPK